MEMFGETRKHKDLDYVEEKCKGKNNQMYKLRYIGFFLRKSRARYQEAEEEKEEVEIEEIQAI